MADENIEEEIRELRKKKAHWELLRTLNSAPAADAALQCLIEDYQRRIDRLTAQSQASPDPPEGTRTTGNTDDNRQGS